jgi:uncharacterized protein (TIGR02996 family)
MTGDVLAFLKRITDDPDDDLPRLVFADWLDEHGLGEYAEFIRLQIDRARRGDATPSARERELFHRNEGWLLGFIPEGFREGIEFRRGFPYRAECDAETLFSRDLEPLYVPVEELTVVVSQLWAGMLGVQPPKLTLPLRSLHVRCEPFLGPELNEHLRRFGPYPRLERLRITDTGYGDEGVRELTPALGFPQVTALDLSHCGIQDYGAKLLADSVWPNQLTELRLAGNPIGEDGWERLREEFGDALVV